MSDANVIHLCKVNQYGAIAKLKFHPENPRTITPTRLEELKESIRSKGFYKPVLVWKKNGIVLDGNHRLLAAKQLIEEGWEFVSPDGKKGVLPIVIEDVSKDVAEQILFESNNNYAEWVEEKLAKAMQDAEASGKDLKQYGFEQAEVDRLLKAALSDAEKVTVEAHERTLGEEKDVPEELADIEEFESAIMPKDTYKRFMGLIADISRKMNEEWHEGDSIGPAVDALVQAAKDNDLVSFIEDQI